MVKKTALTTAASIALVLLIATPCYAHSLHPVFWWLGPFAIVMAIGSIVGCLPLIAIVAGQALVLHRFIPGGRFLGALWRAAVIFVLSQVAEILPAFLNPEVFFGPASDAEVAVIAILMVVASFVANGLLIGLLHWRRRPGMLRIGWLSLALVCISIGGLYVTSTTLTSARIVR